LMHLAHAFTRSPEDNFSHCKFGFCILATLGLYFPLSLVSRHALLLPLWHRAHCLVMK